MDLNELFSVGKEGDYTLLQFKKPINKVIIYDPGLYHTAICKSYLSKVDTSDGKLYYRGELAENKIGEDFLDVAGQIIFGEAKEKKARYKEAVENHFELLPEQKAVIDALPSTVHPMDVLSIATLSLSGLENKYMKDPLDGVEKAGFLTAQVAVTVSYYHTRLKGNPWLIPDKSLPHPDKILKQMHAKKDLGHILNTILILHAEHGQNCSAATVRNIASSKGSIYAAVAAGMGAFNGKVHGGASQLVSEMYEEIIGSGLDVDTYIDRKKEKKELLMGFGQRTYNRIPNCWDPRVETMYRILVDPAFIHPEVEEYRKVAVKLINRVCNDEFFKAKNLTPNPDLFNCIFYKLFGASKEMNTTMLALGRIVGWVANFMEHVEHKYPLTRPCDISL